MAPIRNNLNTVMILASTPFVLGISLNIAEYIMQVNDKHWNINQGSFIVRSLLECSTKCSEMDTICGFNYIRTNDGHRSTVRTCQCFLLSDLNPTGSHFNVSQSFVYIHETCSDIYTDLLVDTTSTSTVTSTSTGTTTLSSTTRTTTSTTTTGATTLSTRTTTSSTTTGTATLPTATRTTTSTTTTGTTTLPPTTRTTTSSTTSGATSSTTTETTTVSTTTVIPTTSSTVTTTFLPCSSTVNALVLISGTIHLFIDDQIFKYSSYSELSERASSTVTLSSLFPEVSYPLDAGYNDGNFVYLIKGTDTWKYTSDQLVFDSKMTTASLTSAGSGDDSESEEDGGGASNSNFDAILHTGTQTYFFTGNSLTIVENGSTVKTVSISNNGNKNPYKSNNFSNRPTDIVAALSIESDIHLFVSQTYVYTFTFSTKLWNNLGQLVCS